jgi:superfamily I DNA and/or RNA helicase
MHPQIRRFPSKEFYNDLIDDDQSVTKRQLPLQLCGLEQIKRRSTFFDLTYSQESSQQTSKNNFYEAEFTVNLVKFIYSTMQKSLGSRQGSQIQ